MSSESHRFEGREYIVSIAEGGVDDYVFTVGRKNRPWFSIIIDGLTKKEAEKLVRVLRGMKPVCIDCWVDFVFFSEDLNGKHAQEHYEDRLNWVIRS